MVSAALVPYLAAKPLLILTGPAGTGKSKGIIELATWFDYGAGLPSALSASAEPPSTAMAFVPVGADWTDQRELLGFRNPFGSARTDDAGNETNLTYHVTTAVRLLLRATHPYVADEPHFLVLDEMNLSHVERYFSSFLSLMEADTSVGSAGRFDLVSRDDVALIAEILDPNRYPMEVEAAKTLATAQSGLPLPANVFVVGTVNVDETTYMFSPKVLDRSFVRELMPVDPRAYLSGTMPPEPTVPGSVALTALQSSVSRRRLNAPLSDPLQLVKDAGAAVGMPTADANAMADFFVNVLAGAFKLLMPVGFGFGYRVVNESALYLAAALRCRHEGGLGLDSVAALDELVLAKVLPKIHGNRRQLVDSLGALSAFLGAKSAPEAEYSLGDATVGIPAGEVIAVALERSSARAMELHRKLQATGYTTFIS
jgi:hypothetical protein